MDMDRLLLKSLECEGLAPAFVDDVGNRLVQSVLSPLAGITVFPRSISVANHRLYFLGQRENTKFVGIMTQAGHLVPGVNTFHAIRLSEGTVHLAVIPADAQAADMLKAVLPFLQPRMVGKRPSIGCGDRLGLATPGHVRALAKTRLGAVLCQQSVRENGRTGRSPRQVLDDAMWGAWQEGWRNGFGADADHVKKISEMDPFIDAGYTFFTVDVGDYLDAQTDSADNGALEAKVAALDWNRLQSTSTDLIHRLTRRPLALDGFSVRLNRQELLHAAAKYGAAIAPILEMFSHLCQAKGEGRFEFEVSVDETETATTLAEHIYLAAELARLGVTCTSLAPRFVGAFEKGVDFIGDLAIFEDSYKRHAAVARTYGDYKLSLHSGSDKFCIYPVVARHSRGAIHVKTAGTSYLEALRTIAIHTPELFRDIVAFCLTRYKDDRVSYHVSAQIKELPPVSRLENADLPGMLNHFHAREILHVTYGSVLNHPSLRQDLFDALHRHLPAYEDNLERHFDRHCAPFG
jgi:hypothetical protein